MGILIFVRTKQIDVTLDFISDEGPGRKNGGNTGKISRRRSEIFDMYHLGIQGIYSALSIVKLFISFRYQEN